MKKVIIILLAIFMVCGCSSENEQALIGEWEYEEETPHYWGNYYSYEFFENNTVKYYECKNLTLSDDGCIDGSAVWMGKYNLHDNIITMNSFEIDTSNSYKYSKNLAGPTNKLIVDFDYMYMCNRDEGLNCNKKYKKNTNN